MHAQPSRALPSVTPSSAAACGSANTLTQVLPLQWLRRTAFGVGTLGACWATVESPDDVKLVGCNTVKRQRRPLVGPYKPPGHPLELPLTPLFTWQTRLSSARRMQQLRLVAATHP